MSSPLPLDPYQVLGVARTADLSAIRTAHRKLVLKYHPDRIKNDADRKKGTEEFTKAQQAYELLSDEKRRARYDDQVRLAALKKEVLDRGGPARSASYPTAHPSTPARTQTSTTYDYRDGRMYEERRPRYSDEDDRYQESPREAPRTSSRKAPAYERKTPTAYPEEKKKKSSEKSASGLSDYIERKLQEKARAARERTAHAESTKNRDRDRKRDAEEKLSSRHRAHVENETSDESDPVYVSRKPPPTKSKTTYDERPRGRKEPPAPPKKKETSRRYTKDDSSSDSEDSYESKDEWERKHNDARNYISERSVPGRPGVLRTDSAQYYTGRRERTTNARSGSDKDDRREEKSRASKPRPAEVETPRRNPQSRKAPPPMQSAKTSPSVLKSMAGEVPRPQRSATGDYPSDHKRPTPMMNRSNTMPVNSSSSREKNAHSKGSKLKQTETHDSGYGSSGPATPEHFGTSPPKSSKTRYFIVPENDEYSRGPARTVPAEEYRRRGARSASRDRNHEREREQREREKSRDKKDERDKKRPERPSVNTSESFKSPRSTGYTMSPEQLSGRPDLFRAASSRPSVPRDSPTSTRGDSGRHFYNEKDDGYRFKPEKVNYSHVSPENVKYQTRRATSDLKDRDVFPGSKYQDNIHGTRTGRRESIY